MGGWEVVYHVIPDSLKMLHNKLNTICFKRLKFRPNLSLHQIIFAPPRFQLPCTYVRPIPFQLG